jgi:anti-sigma B factor antagonist
METTFTRAIAGKVPLLVVQGELDIATKDSFATAAAQFVAASDAAVIIDISGVPYMDSTAVSVLISVEKTCRGAERRLAIVRPAFNTPCARIWDLLQLDRVFTSYETADLAGAELAR